MSAKSQPQESPFNSLSSTSSSSTQGAHSPKYAALAAYMQDLATGDPRERIDIPMIHSHSSRGNHYLRKYAHDASGSYIGTEPVAPDAGLIFVPSKASSSELLEQVKKVASAREHQQRAFAIEGSGAMSGAVGC
ncbi:hypothetical protein SVAN01_02751 [Stagonosporopsis vannaccii]|nr:hypothetical protein SVAN01_02751 [Stagonosporopsis vannaccii]